MSKSVIFSVRVQSQVADANLGTKGLNPLFGVLDTVVERGLINHKLIY